MPADQPIRPRLISTALRRLLIDLPALLVTGPRAVGKTTSAAALCSGLVHLDRPGQAAIFRADPDVALSGQQEPLLLDEWQEVPEVLGAVKRAVDSDSRSGRFILTGSARAPLSTNMWPGTGRLVRVSMFGMTERELSPGFDSDSPNFVERLTALDVSLFTRSELNFRQYIELAVRSGFPELAVRELGAQNGADWLDSYLDQLVNREITSLSPRADVNKLRTYLEVLALNSAGLPSDQTLFDAAGINAKTAARYDQLLSDLFVIDSVPAWSGSRRASVARRAKRYFVDAGLAAAAGHLEAESILSDGDLLGRFLDTFVVAQLRPEIALSPSHSRLRHLRTNNGRHELDLVVELTGGRCVGIEVKATAAPDRNDAKHLLWFSDQIGDKFVAGAVLHTGPDAFMLDERVMAVPISALWSYPD